MQAYLLVALGGAIGSMGRYAVSIVAGRMLGISFPYGTLTVNVLGSLAMGLFIGFLARTTPHLQNEMRLFVAVGLFGGFTTFSSFSLDTITLVERGNVGAAMLYVFVSLLVSFLALWGGLVVMRLGAM